MSQNLQIPNFKQANIAETGELAAETYPGAISLTLVNADKFVPGVQAYIGALGSETGELAVPTAVADQTLTVPATKFHHPRYSKAYVLFGSQARIYRAPNVANVEPAYDSYELIHTLTLDMDQAATPYIDQTGGADYWYVFTYYNTETTNETDRAASMPVRGGSAGHYCSIEAIREAASFENARYITDTMIARHRAPAQAKIDGALSGRYAVPFQAPINAQIEIIARTLSAGYLLVDQYPNQPDRGGAKVKWAEEQLQRIVDGEVILLNAAGATQQTPDNTDGSGYPNNSTQFEYGEARLFRISDVHNDYDRKY